LRDIRHNRGSFCSHGSRLNLLWLTLHNQAELNLIFWCVISPTPDIHFVVFTLAHLPVARDCQEQQVFQLIGGTVYIHADDPAGLAAAFDCKSDSVVVVHCLHPLKSHTRKETPAEAGFVLSAQTVVG
jgi:hypothetical protein